MIGEKGSDPFLSLCSSPRSLLFIVHDYTSFTSIRLPSEIECQLPKLVGRAIFS